MRHLTIALLLAAAPLAAQGTDKPAPTMAKMDMDPTHKVMSDGKLPAGWQARFDHADAKTTDVKFVAMGDGYHVTSGPAAIYWTPANAVNGDFTASVTFTQTKAPMHPEAYGIFWGGKELSGASQNYAYFLVRGDGKFTVKHRANDTDIHNIQPWTDAAAIVKQDANGKATNTLTVRAAADSVRLFVNGTQVSALPRDHMKTVDGAVGLRVNHNLDVHVSNFTVTPAK